MPLTPAPATDRAGRPIWTLTDYAHVRKVDVAVGTDVLVVTVVLYDGRVGVATRGDDAVSWALRDAHTAALDAPPAR